MLMTHIIRRDKMVEFKLTKSISLLNNNELSSLNLDFDALTMSDLKTSNKIAKMIDDNTVGEIDNGAVSPRLNPNLRIAIGWCAALKGTPGLMVNDVLKLAMVDALCLSETVLSEYLFRD